MELYIDRGSKEENLAIFRYLKSRQVNIEEAFGGELIWEPLDNRRACRLKTETDGNIFMEDRWAEMIDFLSSGIEKMEGALKPVLVELGPKLKSNDFALETGS